MYSNYRQRRSSLAVPPSYQRQYGQTYQSNSPGYVRPMTPQGPIFGQQAYAQPFQPVEVIQPVQPVQPVEMVQPVRPVEFVQPVQQARPVEVVQPVQPVQPVEVVQPLQPIIIQQPPPPQPVPVPVPYPVVEQVRVPDPVPVPVPVPVGPPTPPPPPQLPSVPVPVVPAIPGRPPMFRQPSFSTGHLPLATAGFTEVLTSTTVTYPNGDFYVGQVSEMGVPHGEGTYTWADGSVYKGSWRMGFKEGYGVYETLDGYKYAGEWRRSEKWGFGTEWGETLDGRAFVYEGGFFRNQRHGLGTKNGTIKVKYKYGKRDDDCIIM